MLEPNELKPGVTFLLENNIYVVLNYSENKQARSGMVIKVKARNLRTGTNLDLNINDRVRKAHIEKKEMLYLYNDGANCSFMDNETYEQIEIPMANLTWELNFVKENSNVTMSMYEGEILGVILPDKVALEIVECELAVKGNTQTNASKNATLETGFEIRIPQFISEGETILVKTADGTYAGRA